jgi:hypothetical protein
MRRPLREAFSATMPGKPVICLSAMPRMGGFPPPARVTSRHCRQRCAPLATDLSSDINRTVVDELPASKRECVSGCPAVDPQSPTRVPIFRPCPLHSQQMPRSRGDCLAPLIIKRHFRRKCYEFRLSLGLKRGMGSLFLAGPEGFSPHVPANVLLSNCDPA